jgi:hypothetical protein
VRAELDAIYAHLYGLTKEELDYILETFPIVKMKDIEKYGSYRTKELILKYYDEYSDKMPRQEEFDFNSSKKAGPIRGLRSGS